MQLAELLRDTLSASTLEALKSKFRSKHRFAFIMKSPAMASADELLLLAEHGFSLKSLIENYHVGDATLSQREINFYTYNEQRVPHTKESLTHHPAHAGRQPAAV